MPGKSHPTTLAVNFFATHARDTAVVSHCGANVHRKEKSNFKAR